MRKRKGRSRYILAASFPFRGTNPRVEFRPYLVFKLPQVVKSLPAGSTEV